MNHFLGDPAFSAGDSVYTWGDVVLAAVHRGDWSRLEEVLRRKLALLAEAEERGDAPTEEELDAAAQEFRYERDLITGEDMEAWLTREGISVDDWMDYVERSLVFSRAGEAGMSTRDEDADADADADVAARIAVEAICSGALMEFAEALAARVAVAARPLDEPESGSGRADAESPPPEEVRHAARSAAADALRFGLADLASEPEGARLEELARAELVSAAREAALCVRDDGASFEAVAESAHVSARREHLFAEELDPATRADLLSARPGEIVGPIAFGDGFHLYRLHGKTMPTERDPDVRRRGEAAVLHRLLDEETRSRICWLERH